jgi:hypothetical protein
MGSASQFLTGNFKAADLRGKSLPLNQTNLVATIDKYGDDFDNWIGQPVTLTPDMTDFKGKPTPCIRLTF